jgi:hypothetical protein
VEVCLQNKLMKYELLANVFTERSTKMLCFMRFSSALRLWLLQLLPFSISIISKGHFSPPSCTCSSTKKRKGQASLQLETSSAPYFLHISNQHHSPSALNEPRLFYPTSETPNPANLSALSASFLTCVAHDPTECGAKR